MANEIDPLTATNASVENLPAPETTEANSGGGISIEPVPPEGVTTVVQTPEKPPEEEVLTPEILNEEIRRLDRIMAGMALVLTFLLASFVAHNTDIWMHLATGRLIAQGQYHFGGDPFSYTTQGVEWVNHSWLYDLGTYALAQAFGGPETALGGAALVAVKALLLTLLAWVMLLISRPGVSRWLPCVCVTLAVLTMCHRWFLQPSVISFLFTGLTLYLLYRSGEGSLGGTAETEATAALGTSFQQPRPASVYLYGLPVLFALWANLDDWFVVGPLMVALYLVGLIVDRMYGTPQERAAISTSRLSTLAVVLVIGTLACALNPFHVHAFRLPSELWALVTNQPLQNDPWFRGFFVPGMGRDFAQSVVAIPYFVLIAVSLGSFALNYGGIRWWRAVVWVGFWLLSAAMARTIPFFAIVAGPIAALNLQDFAVRRFGKTVPIDGNLKNWSLAGRIMTLIAGIFLIVLAWPGWLSQGSQDARRTRRVAWAVEVDPSLRKSALALGKLREQGVFGADSNGFNWIPDVANYCAWFCPEEKSFVDYRLPLFAGVGKSYLETRRDLDPRTKSGDEEESDWRKTFREHHIDHIIVSHPDRIGSDEIIQKLWRDKDQWTLLYLDGRTGILGWKDPESRASHKALDSHVLDPLRSALSNVPDDDKAPTNGTEAPQHPGLFSEFLHGPAHRPLEADEAAIYLDYYESTLRQVVPCYVATNWIRSAAAPAAALGSGVAGAALPINMAMIFELPPELTGISTANTAPVAPLLAAIRAARRAIADSPDHPDAYLALAQAYNRLWDNHEKVWGAAPQLRQLRQCQIVNALQNALTLRPDNRFVHLALVQMYRDMGYIDLEMEQWQEAIKSVRNGGPGVGESEEQYQRNVAALEESYQRRQDETQFQNRQNDYELTANAKPPQLKAKIALDHGLVRQALDILKDADPASIGPEEADVLIPLLITTGQADEVQRAEFKLSDWYATLLAAIYGDYQRLDQQLSKIVTSKQDANVAQLLMQLNEQTFQYGIQPMALQSMNQMLVAFYEGTDMQILRGILAVEQGENAKGIEAMKRGVDLNASVAALAKAVEPLSGTTPLKAAAATTDAVARPARAYQSATLSAAKEYLKLLGKSETASASAK